MKPHNIGDVFELRGVHVMVKPEIDTKRRGCEFCINEGRSTCSGMPECGRLGHGMKITFVPLTRLEEWTAASVATALEK